MPKKSSGSLIKTLNLTQGDDISGFAEELQSGTDRATAILGGVFLDELLQVVLKNFMIDENAIVDELFKPEKPLSTFSARTRTAYGLGLIHKEAYDDINKIRTIRNVFAHALHGIDFSQSDLNQWCNDLSITQRLMPAAAQPYTARTLYINAVIFTAMYLREIAQQVKSIQRKTPKTKLMIQWQAIGTPESISPVNPYIVIEKPEK